MIKSNPQTKSTHLLLVIIEDHEVTIDTIILSDKMEQRYSNITKCDKVLAFHLVVKSVRAEIWSTVVQRSSVAVDVVPDLEDSTLSL